MLLAVTSCVLALLGCEISVACYSAYLSKRDFELFSTVFQAFGVQSHIHYGTFHQLCERQINHQGNVRRMAESAIIASSSLKESSVRYFLVFVLIFAILECDEAIRI